MSLLRRLARCDRAAAGDNVIVHALMWAAAILSTSWVLRGSEHSETVLMLLIGFSSVAITSGASSRRGARRCVEASDAP